MNDSKCVKVCFLGDTNVGKTSIIFKQQNELIDPLSTTSPSIIRISIDDNVLELVDTAGQERFRSITNNYYRQASIAILVYSVCDRISFNGMKTFYENLKNVNPDARVIVVGNKSDLPNHVVSDEEGSNYAKAINANFIITSAKTGDGIKELFQQISLIASEVNIAEINGVDISKSEEKKGGCC